MSIALYRQDSTRSRSPSIKRSVPHLPTLMLCRIVFKIDIDDYIPINLIIKMKQLIFHLPLYSCFLNKHYVIYVKSNSYHIRYVNGYKLTKAFNCRRHLINQVLYSKELIFIFKSISIYNLHIQLTPQVNADSL